MLTALRARILPDAQRRTLDELSDDLELRTGDVRTKRSAFWTMLTLSGIVATAGIMSDSTATVIGAMIIAPLSTPIMGIALAAVKRRRNGSVTYVLAGAALVVLIGVLAAAVLPGSYELTDNSQITARTSPGLLDLVAAQATGLAGAVALARRDVAAVLPGVAIAISLVPPLAVVGICLGRGAFALAAGASLLFLSNLVALVLAGMFVFVVLGYPSELVADGSRGKSRTYVTFVVLAVVLGTALVLNTAFSVLVSSWEATIQRAGVRWLATVPGSSVDGVDLHSATFRLRVQTPGALPPTDLLLSSLAGEVPDGLRLEIVSSRGETIDVGAVGG